MSVWISRWPGLLAALAVVLLAACSPWLGSPRDDEHPLISEAMARKAVSPREAARLLEKALEANPHLARAHWELGLICLNNTSNHAAAVYHFQRVLALRPDWPHGNTATQLIAQAKIELVKEGVEAPTLPSAKQQLDRYVMEIHRLNGELTNLHAQVRNASNTTQQLRVENLQLRQQIAAAGRDPQAVAASSANAGAESRLASPPAARQPVTRASGSPQRSGTAATASPASRSSQRPAATAASTRSRAPAAGATAPATASRGSRSHTVKAGETLASIAKRYHLTTRDVRSVNPGVSTVRVGQVIRLP